MPASDPGDSRTPLAAYAVALVGYVILGYFFQSLVLNWIVGPLFPLITLWLLPTLVSGLRR